MFYDTKTVKYRIRATDRMIVPMSFSSVLPNMLKSLEYEAQHRLQKGWKEKKKNAEIF